MEQPKNQEPPKKPLAERLVDVDFDESESQKWEDLLQSVEATDVPLEMLKYLRVHKNDGEKTVFPIITWTKEGVAIDEIKRLVTSWYDEHKTEIAGSDFVVNLDKLKDTVKTQTDKTLKDL